MSSTTKPTLNPSLSDFWKAPARNKILYGGRSSSKSWDAAGFAVFLAQVCKIRVMCTRQFQNRIEESVYTLLIVQIDRFGLRDQFTILNNKITHNKTGSEFIFFGIQRNYEDIKSTEGIDVWWAEEAWFLTKEQWRDINPTIRKEGSQVWLIFNPRFVTDFIWRKFVVGTPDNTVVRKINYDENPFLSSTMIALIEEMRREDEEEYNHVYQGQPLSSDERSIIKRAWVMSAVDAHVKLGITPVGAKRIGYDVANDGADKCATVEAHGLLTMDIDQWKGQPDDLMGSSRRVFNRALMIQAHTYYDNIGVGASTGSHYRELNRAAGTRLVCTGFGAGEKVHKPDREYRPGLKNKDHFANAKAQAWGSVADRLSNTYRAVTYGDKFQDDELISISSDCQFIDALADELAMPHKDYDPAGRFKVQSKKELEFSPNLADAFIMAYSPIVASVINYGDLL